ncbi:DUF4358 domain-containing protein [Paenibacillus sp. L3-i20]|uniref:DUF4358 domain-containing protein n=1 Tax=Paenibacillus sp. L3-i20 TaxID=2905833 RepID=UPI001EE0E199|nr:DUF4358 domain-containing protein [Paenibacillus sp. L3-i20]GKU80455.1 hypothetical protein L3i20_v248520 [Paenibacillus sp. L3-i20]
MKKRVLNLLMVVAMGIALTACGGEQANKDVNVDKGTNTSTTDTGANKDKDKEPVKETETDKEAGKGDETEGTKAGSTNEIVEAILAKVEQPVQMPIEADKLKDMYYLDAALLEEYTIKTPMMNVKTNEIAVLKVKDAKDIPAVEEAIKKRATDVQKQFETYLQDQYENAKNYKLVTKGNYILFVIAEDADKMVAEFEALVK